VAQFARPISDVSLGGWTTNTGSAASLFAAIDEDSANDADFIRSSLTVNDAYIALLSSVAPAVIPRAHSVIIRGLKDASGGNQRGVDVALMQGASTVIGSTSFPNLPVTVTQQVIDVPRAWAAQITNYADLRIRVTATGSVAAPAGNRRRAILTGATLRVPAASDLVDDLLTRWGVTVDSSGVTVQVSKSGFVGIGDTLARAIWLLLQSMQADEAFYAANAAEIDRRFTIAYGLWKVIEYERYRADMVAGTIPLPQGKTLPETLAIIDAKIGRFTDRAKNADAQDGA
jgi:hypothetical protein